MVEIDEGPSLRENTLADKNSLNQDDFKNEPLLPTDEDVNRMDSNLDLRDKTRLRDDDNLDEDNDNIHLVNDSFTSDNDCTVLLTEKRISLDGNLRQTGESSSLEGNEISVEGTSSHSQMFVEEPDLSHEMFETLWMQLPET